MDIRFLTDHALTRGFSDDELKELHDVLEPVSLPQNQTLLAEGQPTAGLFIIGAGTVKITKLATNGTIGTLAELESPTLIGEMELLTQRPCAASAISATDVVGGKLSHESFQRLVERGDAMVSKLIRNIARVLVLRLEATNDRLIAMVQPEKAREFESFKQKLIANWNF